MIPMRDGVQLFTSIYSPKDQSKPYPIILRRTPYSCGPYGTGSLPTSFQTLTSPGQAIFLFFKDVRALHERG